MHHVYHTKLGEGRRVAIPAEVCRRFGISPGDPVVVEADDGGVRVRSLAAVIREVQDHFARLAPPGMLISEELIRDRRAEAEHD
jgi:AbrB family looped-hinge helix DNA binding protein